MVIRARSCSAANASRSGPRHGAVVVDHLAQHAGRPQPGQHGAGRRPPRCARPAQHTAGLRPQRHHVARPGQVGRPGAGGGEQRGWCAPGRPRRCRCVTPSRASTDTVYAVPRRSWLVWYIGGSSSRSASLLGHRHADVARSVADHERRSAPGVACSAAKIRSPSFSRSSSSTTITGLPGARCPRRRSIGVESSSCIIAALPASSRRTWRSRRPRGSPARRRPWRPAW